MRFVLRCPRLVMRFVCLSCVVSCSLFVCCWLSVGRCALFVVRSLIYNVWCSLFVVTCCLLFAVCPSLCDVGRLLPFVV